VPLDLRRPRDLGKILDDAFGLYRAHWRTFLAIGLVVVVPVDVAVLGVGLGWLWSGYDAKLGVAGTLVPVVSEWLVITPLVVAMTAHALLDLGAGRPPRLGAAIQAGLEIFAPLFATMLLVGAGLVLGFAVLVVPGVILGVLWAVVPQAVVIEALRGPAALRRSTALVAGSGWWTCAILLTVNLIALIVTGAVTLPLDAAAKAANSQAITLGAEVLGHVLTYPLLALAGTLMYFSLRVRKGEAAALPGNDPWERRRAEGWEPPSAL
jgi:hypothetical protein